MLITLQSNSDSDANQFTNFFKEPVQIQPNSEVALVSIAYKFENSIVVNATNDTYTIQLGTESLNVTIAQATYDSDTFLAALNTGLNTALAAAAYRTQLAFPSGGCNWSWANATKTQLKLTLAYNPGNWNDDDGLVNDSYNGTTIRKEVLVSDTGMMNDSGDGIMIKVSTAADSWTNNVAVAGTASTFNALWGTAANLPTTPAGNLKFKALATQYDVFLGFSNTTATINSWVSGASTQLVSGIRLISDGTYTIEEYDSTTGFLEAITTAPIAYAQGDVFEIRVAQEPTDEDIRYYQNGVEITAFDNAAERYVFGPTTKLYPRASIENQVLANEIVQGTGTTNNYQMDNVIDVSDTTITTPGTSYKVNDQIKITGNVSTNVSNGYITSIDGNGGITGFVIKNHVEGWSAGDTACVVQGITSGNGDCVIDVGTNRINSATLNEPGTGYSAADADIYADDGTTVLAAAGVTIISVGGGGDITDFSWNVQLPNTVVVEGYELQIRQGGAIDARVTINAVNNYIARVGGVQWTTVLDSVTDSPLAQHQNSQYTPSVGFSSLSLTYANTSNGPVLTETGVAGVNGDRETNKMLVNIDQFQIASICKEGGVQKAVGMVPYGARYPDQNPAPRLDGEFFEEPYNILYHELGNKIVENHNQIQVRLTDAVGNRLTQLQHPTTITLDLRPKAK